jgi:hypothetical protein
MGICGTPGLLLLLLLNYIAAAFSRMELPTAEAGC